MSVIDRKGMCRADDVEPGLHVWETRPAEAPVVSSYFKWKGLIDAVLAVVLLIPALPIIGVLVLLVRVTSRGPGIYRQSRVGKHGRVFRMYKIRTMTDNAEEKSGPVWTRRNDGRITRVGRLLRKLHLDEFPQLFNVLRGDMSLIGPRPERPEFVGVLADEIPGYANRLTVQPGITGLAQINLPPDTDMDSVRRKLVLDLEYIKTAGVLLDVRMFLCTSVRLLGLPGALAMHTFGLHRHVVVPRSYVAPARGWNGAAATDDSPVTPETIAGTIYRERTPSPREISPATRAGGRDQPDAHTVRKAREL